MSRIDGDHPIRIRMGEMRRAPHTIMRVVRRPFRCAESIDRPKKGIVVSTVCGDLCYREREREKENSSRRRLFECDANVYVLEYSYNVSSIVQTVCDSIHFFSTLLRRNRQLCNVNEIDSGTLTGRKGFRICRNETSFGGNVRQESSSNKWCQCW